MTSPSLSLGECPTQQARNAGVPPPPAHVAPNAAVPPLEGSSGQQDPDSSGRRPSQLLRVFLGGQQEGSLDQLSPDDSSGSRRPAPVQRRPRHAVCGRRNADSPDLLSPNSSSSRPGQGRPEAAPCGLRWLEVVGFCFLTFNSFMAIYRSRGNAGDTSFVVCAYMTLVSLFFAIRQFKAAPPNSRRREEVKVCVWMFTMSLTIGFVYQIITTAKPTLHLIVLLWAIPAGTGISVLIIYGDRSGAHLSEELDV